jgi:hypothetical protein
MEWEKRKMMTKRARRREMKRRVTMSWLRDTYSAR